MAIAGPKGIVNWELVQDSLILNRLGILTGQNFLKLEEGKHQELGTLFSNRTHCGVSLPLLSVLLIRNQLHHYSIIYFNNLRFPGGRARRSEGQ
jgi:hypothetical protein